VTEVQSLGIEVSAVTLDMFSKSFNANNMVDLNGIIEENLKPFILSDYRRRFKKIIDMV
jgi:hypothetical protein